MSTAEIAVTEITTGENYRTQFDPVELTKLSDSIVRLGVIEPLVVTGKAPNYELVAGERRLRAAKQAGLKTVPCVIKVGISQRERDEVMLAENKHRVDPDPIDQANMFQRLSDRGWTMSDMCDATGESETFITRKLGLLRLRPEIGRMVSRGTLPEAHGKSMSKLDQNRQMLALKAWQSIEGGLSWTKFDLVCEQIYSEQQQESMFNVEDFMKVDEYIADVEKKATLMNRHLVHLILMMEEVIDETADPKDPKVVRIAEIIDMVREQRKGMVCSYDPEVDPTRS